MMPQFEPDSSELDEDISQPGNAEDFQEQDQELTEKEDEQLVQNVDVDSGSFSDPLKLLQEHGITMLQNEENEENHILSTVMESGHSVVLTDVGKEVLNSVKQSEQQQLQMDKKIVTLTPEEFLAMTNGSLNNKGVYKQFKVIPVKKQVKRIVMKKNKCIPVTSVTNIPREQDPLVDNKYQRTNMHMVMTQLIEARQTIEEYKLRLQKKEQEAERYKMQLRLLMDPS